MLIKLKLTPKINKVTIKAKEQTKQTDRRLLLIGNFHVYQAPIVQRLDKST